MRAPVGQCVLWGEGHLARLVMMCLGVGAAAAAAAAAAAVVG